jgi:hypothetical protein
MKDFSSYALSLAGVVLVAVAAIGAEVRGVISKVDTDKNEVVVEGRGRGARGMAMTFVLDKDTQILIGRQPGKPGDLHVGKRARVVYEDRGGKPVAVRITVPPALLAQTKPQTEPAISTNAGAITGTLRRVALTDREIVIVGGSGAGGQAVETTLFVPAQAKISRGDKAISFDDLREGESVAAHAEKRDGVLEAKSIQVGGGSLPAPLPTGQQVRGERVRHILKMVDSYLEEMQGQSNQVDGGPIPPPPPGASQPPGGERIRQILKMVDSYLEELGKK